MTVDNQKLDHKQSLSHLSTRLKQVLNPVLFTSQDEEGFSLLKAETNISSSYRSNIFLSITGVTTSNTIVDFLGNVDLTNYDDDPGDIAFGGNNTGTSFISFIGINLNVENIYFIIGGDSFKEISVEVFIQDPNGTKNRVTSLSIVEEEETLTASYSDFTGTSIPAISFGIKTASTTPGDEHIIHIDANNPAASDNVTIDQIYQAERLSQPIDILINDQSLDDLNFVEDDYVYGDGAHIDFTTDRYNLDIHVDTDTLKLDIIQLVENDFTLAPASVSSLGGVKVYSDRKIFNPSNIIPLKLDTNNRAYIDGNSIQDYVLQDVHRYNSMSIASQEHPNLGEIVQYIGNTNTNYTKGYFYIRVRELIVGTPELNGTLWLCPDATVLNDSLTEYNKQQDHILVIGKSEKPLVITPNLTEDDTITSDTYFTITNDSFSDIVTYGDLIEFGISLTNLNYIHTNRSQFSLTIGLNYLDPENPDNPRLWVLKNVLPPINVPAALVYKGIATWAELELKTPISKPGDFYTISDKSNQEYFFNGIITSNWEDSWEYMGEVITIPEYTAGDHISIEDYEISTTGLLEELSSGDNIDIDDNVISALGYYWDSSYSSIAEGENINTASGTHSHAEGEHTETHGDAAHSEGSNTVANSDYSHTEGENTEANGKAAHAEGSNTIANDNNSHAEGKNTKTDAKSAHSEGEYTIAKGKASHAEGFGILCNTNSSGFSWETTTLYDSDIKLILDSSVKTNRTLTREFSFINNYDLELNIYSRSTKKETYAHVQKIIVDYLEYEPELDYSDDDEYTFDSVEIYFNLSDLTILEGTSDILDFLVYTTAENLAAHAEGKNTCAYNKNSHAEGLVTKAEGENSHVEGHLNFINGDGYNAHAEGYNTRAMKNQAHSEGANTLAYGENSHVEGEETCAWGKDSHAEGKSSQCPSLYNETYFDEDASTVYNAWKSHYDSSSGNYACAWGSVSHIEGKDNLALGNNSHAEGQATCAYGDKSHAEGYGTLAKGNNSHAEGDGTSSEGNGSHTEGFGSKVETTALYAHAEGCKTTAKGTNSHAEGEGTVTNNNSEHAEGLYNKSHTGQTEALKTIHSVGIGNATPTIYGYNYTYKNAFEITLNGDAYLYGVGNYDGTALKGSNTVLTLQDVLTTIPAAANNATYSVKTDVSGTETTVSDFTADQSTADEIIFVQGNNITLTPDATNKKITIAATDTTYNDFSGSTHGLVPVAQSEDSGKFLKGDGSWATPTDNDTTYKFTIGSTTYGDSNGTSLGSLTSETAVASGTALSLVTTGEKDSWNNKLPMSGGTLTGQVYYNESGSVTTTVTCTRKYNWLEVSDNVNTTNGAATLSITMPLSLEGPCDVIYAVKNMNSNGGNNITLNLPSTGHNMCSSSLTIPPQKIAELIFTFWSTTEVSFNGGVEI